MKKLLIAAAAIAVGSACMADAIESANVVGYSTVTFAAGDRYVICGIPFDNTADPVFYEAFPALHAFQEYKSFIKSVRKPCLLRRYLNIFIV